MYLLTPSSNPSSLVSVIRNVAILPTSGSISAWGETSLRSRGTSPSLGRSPSLLTTPPSPPRRGSGPADWSPGPGGPRGCHAARRREPTFPSFPHPGLRLSPAEPLGAGAAGPGTLLAPAPATPRECPAPATPPEAAGATAPGRGGAPAARLAPHTPRGRVPGAPPSAAPTRGEQPAPSQLRPISPATSLVPLGVPRASPGGPLEPSRVTVTLLQCSFLFEALQGTVCTCSPMMGQLRDMRDP